MTKRLSLREWEREIREAAVFLLLGEFPVTGKDYSKDRATVDRNYASRVINHR